MARDNSILPPHMAVNICLTSQYLNQGKITVHSHSSLFVPRNISRGFIHRVMTQETSFLRGFDSFLNKFSLCQLASWQVGVQVYSWCRVAGNLLHHIYSLKYQNLDRVSTLGYMCITSLVITVYISSVDETYAGLTRPQIKRSMNENENISMRSGNMFLRLTKKTL